MKHGELSQSPRPLCLALSGTLLCLGLAGCGGGGGPRMGPPSFPGGQIAQKPDGSWFYADASQGGYAQEPRIVRQMHGRLVQVFGLDAFGARVPMFSDFVVDAALVSDGQDFLRETNPVTSQELLVILREVTDSAKNGGRDQFFDLLRQAEQGLAPIFENDAQGSGIYSMVPRNAAIVLHFDDLIDGATLDATTVRLLVGDPPVVPFEARVFMDQNHGNLADHDGVDGLEYYGTRIIIDATVSELESFAQEPPLPVNGVGLPPSHDVNLANALLRIPTKINANGGQLALLRNPSGHAISPKNNGPTDDSNGTEDVVRAARSGGPGELTGDPFNGFLPDQLAPQLVGSTPLNIVDPPEATGSAGVFRLPLVRFESVSCSRTPGPGDVLRQPGLFAEVLVQGTPVDGNGEARDVLVRLLQHPFDSADDWAGAGIGAAQFLAAYDPLEDAGREDCFVRVFPNATGFPEHPLAGVHTNATYSLRFSEPMDPASLTAFDSVTMTRKPVPEEGALSSSDYVVGSLTQSIDLHEFSFLSAKPLAHLQGQAESYWTTLASGARGPSDLAGNPLQIDLPSVELTIDPTEATQHNSGRVTRFTGVDEEPPFGDEVTGPLPEWDGQHLYDLQRQLIRPRPVVHFNSVADRSKALPQLMTPFPQGVQTPLSGLGSRTQILWRYPDFGWSLTDANLHNIDVEGLYWSPATGAIVAETFSDFSIRVGHSKYLPDEYLNPASLLPDKKDSGLLRLFDANWLKKSETRLVHTREQGYVVSPGELFVHPVSGTKLMPFPWNQGASPEEWTTWTWRNGDQRKRAGKDGSGAPIMQEYLASGSPFPGNINKSIYAPDQVLADGLPLLMEFRCYPDSGAVGLNAFDISLALNNSARPYFRAFSTGGINEGTETVLVHPDTEDRANGGFNPGSTPPGAETYGLDNSFYIGAADFVTRVSRVHSIWFPANDPFSAEGELFEDAVYGVPLKEPRDEDQPDGTAVKLHFRGASDIRSDLYKCCSDPMVQNLEPLQNAQLLDSFGDYYDHGCLMPNDLPLHNTKQENRACDAQGSLEKLVLFLDGNEAWLPQVASIDGATYYQVRITFESDIFTGLVPELSALALSWSE